MSFPRSSMAKDVIKKKQRIAHNKINEGHALCSEFNDDFLSTIMEGMNNNNLLSMCSNKFETNLPIVTTIPQEKTQSGVNQIPVRNANAAKSKGFIISRKGPLMEKSQRALKQLQHNRKQPKPRAHLATFSSSPPLENSISVQNVKAKGVNNVKSTSRFQSKKTNEEIADSKIVTVGKTVKKGSIQDSTDNKIKNNKVNSKKPQVSKMKENTGCKESSYKVDVTKKPESAYGKIDNSSDSDEYEKFIRKEKKDLPKKAKNKKSINEKSHKSLKVTKKRTSKPVSESDPDISDDESHYSCRRSKRTKKNHDMLYKQSTVSKDEKVSRKVSKKYISKPDSESSEDETNSSKSYKKRKLRGKINRSSTASKAASESEMDINNETYHNSSSESELPSPSELYGLSPANKFSEHVSKEDNLLFPSDSLAVDCSALVTGTDKPNTLSNKTSPLEIPDNAASVNKQTNIFRSEITSLPLVGTNAKPNVLLKSSDIHASVNNSPQLNLSLITPKLLSSNGEDVPHQNTAASRNSMQENFTEPLIIDLAESDNDEYETSSSKIPNINNSQSDSGESDVELVDLILPANLKKEVEQLSVERQKQNAASNSTNRQDELNIKIEKVCSTGSSSGNVQCVKSSNSESQTQLTGKHEVAYRTGICQTFSEKNEYYNTIKKQLRSNSEHFQNEKSEFSNKSKMQLSSNNELCNNIVAGVKESCVSGKIKKEPSDDFKINSDTVSTNNLSLPNKKIEGNKMIKVERISEAVSSSLNLASKQVHCNKSIKVEKGSEIKQTSSHALNSIISVQSTDARNSNDILVSKIKVKEEPCDDCEIIFPTKTIKVERDSKAVKQVSAAIHTTNVSNSSREIGQLGEKSPEILCSSINSHNQTVHPTANENLTEMSIALFEDLKSEFIAYKKLLVTEHSMEAIHKVLQVAQADKRKALKAKIEQTIKHLPSDSCDSIKRAIDKLLNIPELNNSTFSGDLSSSDITTLANLDLVPLSSIPVTDIKPSLSELQCIVKKEPSSSYEIDNMSFGQKCIVCAKEASAACQQCAKVFYCSNKCGRKYWEDGHKDTCVK